MTRYLLDTNIISYPFGNSRDKAARIARVGEDNVQHHRGARTALRMRRERRHAAGATVVTVNTAEFRHVRGLRVENWLA